jgi:hypothetical protein
MKQAGGIMPAGLLYVRHRAARLFFCRRLQQNGESGLQSVHLFRSELPRLFLLNNELFLNDLQLIDRLLLSHSKALCRLQNFCQRFAGRVRRCSRNWDGCVVSGANRQTSAN